MNNIISKIKEMINKFIKKILKKPMFIELIIGSLFSILIIFFSVSGSERQVFVEDFKSYELYTESSDEDIDTDDDDWSTSWDDLEKGEAVSLKDIVDTPVPTSKLTPKPTSTPVPTKVPTEQATLVPEEEVIIEETPAVTVEPYEPEKEPEIILDPNGPVIVSDFEDSHITYSPIEALTLTGYYSNGEKMPEDKVFVFHNDTLVKPELTYNQSYSYQFEYSEGKNIIDVILVDETKENRQFQYTVYFFKSYEPSVVISVDAESIGMGYMVKPTHMVLREDKPIAWYIREILSINGFTTFSSGSQTNNYILKGIYKTDLFKDCAPSISEELVSELLLYNPLLNIDSTKYYNNFIKNDYFTNGSAWVIELNGEIYTDSISNYSLQDGDVLRIRYSLADGLDLKILEMQKNSDNNQPSESEATNIQ